MRSDALERSRLLNRSRRRQRKPTRAAVEGNVVIGAGADQFPIIGGEARSRDTARARQDKLNVRRAWEADCLLNRGAEQLRSRAAASAAASTAARGRSRQH